MTPQESEARRRALGAARSRKYYSAHPEKSRTRSREYALDHAEEVAWTKKLWYLRNKVRLKEARTGVRIRKTAAMDEKKGTEHTPMIEGVCAAVTPSARGPSLSFDRIYDWHGLRAASLTSRALGVPFFWTSRQALLSDLVALGAHEGVFSPDGVSRRRRLAYFITSLPLHAEAGSN